MLRMAKINPKINPKHGNVAWYSQGQVAKLTKYSLTIL